jgi:hypothetical protein
MVQMKEGGEEVLSRERQECVVAALAMWLFEGRREKK